VRRLAGVGRLADRRPEPRDLGPGDAAIRDLEERYDVVVVGSGLSGMAAAAAAAEAGAGVLLVDEYHLPGGHSIGYQADPDFSAMRDDLIARTEDAEKIHILRGTTAYGFYPPGRLMVGRGSASGMAAVSAKSFVIATGALDVTPLFENNDLPGVFGARAIRLFLERDGLLPAKNAVVYGTGAGLVDTAGLLMSRGIRVNALVDSYPAAPGGFDPRAAGLPPGTRIETAASLVRAEGDEWISRAVFEKSDGTSFSVPCDMLCIAVPGQPSFELPQQAGFDFRFAGDPAVPDLRVMQPTDDTAGNEGGARVFLTGEAAGIPDWKEKINHAVRAGVAAVEPTP
jgi:sarcosine oxidase subunit alpha